MVQGTISDDRATSMKKLAVVAKIGLYLQLNRQSMAKHLAFFVPFEVLWVYKYLGRSVWRISLKFKSTRFFVSDVSVYFGYY